MPAPMPEAPPVTMAVRPAKRLLMAAAVPWCRGSFGRGGGGGPGGVSAGVRPDSRSEASRHLTEALNLRHTEIPWWKVAGVGTVLADGQQPTRHGSGRQRRSRLGVGVKDPLVLSLDVHVDLVRPKTQ